jgi:hypothetical protein
MEREDGAKVVREPSRDPFHEGLPSQPLRESRHICQIYTHPEEREEAILHFLRNGFRSGQDVFWVARRVTGAALREALEPIRAPMEDACRAGRFQGFASQEYFLKEGSFDPRRMLGQWQDLYAQARSRGASGLWGIGEALPEVGALQGGIQLAIYEKSLDDWLRSHPCVVVCQYDAGAFDGHTLMRLLEAHPLVLTQGELAANPYYQAPHRLTSH